MPLEFRGSNARLISAAAAIAAATAAARARLARTSLIHGQVAAVVVVPVEGFDRGVSVGVSGHLHEAESLGSVRVAVDDDLSALHRAVVTKQLLQVGVGDVVG